MSLHVCELIRFYLPGFERVSRRSRNNRNRFYASKQSGCKNKPLIEIDPRKIVPDNLHLFLRIYDILMSNLLDDCRQLGNKAEVLN